MSAKNLTTDGIWTHAWNYDNTLASSTDGTNISNYVYDVDKSRLKLVEGADVTYYPSPYYEVENGVVKVNIQKDGKTIATKTGTMTEHIHSDHLGGTHIITDNAGVVVKTKDYFPFGGERVNSGTSNEDNGFTGYEHDESTGLDYAEARYYNSEIGRFISQDPVALILGNSQGLQKQINISTQEYLANPQTHNSYTYAFNNPVKMVDRDGEWAGIDDFVAVVGGFTVGVIGQGIEDVISGNLSDFTSYYSSGVGGAVTAEVGLYTVPTLGLQGAFIAGFAGESSRYSVEKFMRNDIKNWSSSEMKTEGVRGGIFNLIPGLRVKGLTAGQGNWNAIQQQIGTKLEKGLIKNVSGKTILKSVGSGIISGFGGAVIEGEVKGAKNRIDKKTKKNKNK